MPAAASPPLVGRDAELQLIAERLDALGDRGGALHLVGEAGIGKTAVLERALWEGRRRGFTVLTARGVASEAHLRFATLHSLLRPLLGRVGTLPANHERALLSAFGVVETESPPERLFVALGALELVGDAAAESPVLMIVDDLPWVDAASREAIEFVARRIDDEPTLALLASREAGDPLGTTIQLGRLDPRASLQLVRSRVGTPLDSTSEAAILEMANGNPLALAELTPEDAGSFDRLERAFSARLAGLPVDSRRSLLAVALQDGDRIAEAQAALRFVDAAAKFDLDAAVTLGMVAVNDGSCRFRHPLMRSAVVTSAAEPDRAAIHRGFADTLGNDPDRAAWHRALAADAPDEDLAADLERGADRALGRGAADTAEEWFVCAARLSGDDVAKGHRLIRAAETAFELGRQHAVEELMMQARALPLDPTDFGRLARLEGAFDDGTPGDEDAVRRLATAARRAADDRNDELAAALLLGAAMPCYWGGSSDAVREHVRGAVRALDLHDSDPRVMVLRALTDPFRDAPTLIGQLQTWAEADTSEPALAGALARTAFVVGDFNRALVFATRSCEGLRGQGRIALLTQALVLQTFSALYLGRWDVMKVAADEAYRFATETHQPVWRACARLGQANLAGLQGDDQTALELADEVAGPPWSTRTTRC